ncbi:MAG: hypothetical protein ABIT04_07690 [Novosphingobium sp.]
MEENPQFRPQPAAAQATSGRSILPAALLAFLLGAAIVGWLGWQGELDRFLTHPHSGEPFTQASLGRAETEPNVAARAAAGVIGDHDAVNAMEVRLALLEDRFSRLSLQADAASGNAARAEALLIALAARRMIDRGQPLGYVEEPLKLRFGNAQPQAVRTLVAFAHEPLTLDALDARLDLLVPRLADAPLAAVGWTRLQRELASLFAVRRDPMPSLRPEDRVARAKLKLASGRLEAAIDEVGRLHGGVTADRWIADVRRYGAAQQALELIEATAMIDPRGPRDDQGRDVGQPSPLAPGATPSQAGLGRSAAE